MGGSTDSSVPLDPDCWASASDTGVETGLLALATK